jgi:hypothetical protein
MDLQSLLNASNKYYLDFNCPGSIVDLTALYSLECNGTSINNFAEKRIRTMGALAKLTDSTSVVSSFFSYLINYCHQPEVSPKDLDEFHVRND